MMVDTLTWNSILPEAVTSLSSQPLHMTAEKQVTGCTKSLVSCRVEIHMWRLIIHISNTGHDMTSCYQVPWGLSVSHRQLSFSEWWGLMVYVSAVGSAASAWAGRVSITFISCVGQIWDAGVILDWDTLIHTDKFYQAKTTRLVTLPLAPWHSSCQHLPHILY